MLRGVFVVLRCLQMMVHQVCGHTLSLLSAKDRRLQAAIAPNVGERV